jgi:hypothetical protein
MADRGCLNDGTLNNIASSLQHLNPFRKKPPLKGCGEQADKVESALITLKTDARWHYVEVNEGMNWPIPPFPFHTSG